MMQYGTLSPSQEGLLCLDLCPLFFLLSEKVAPIPKCHVLTWMILLKVSGLLPNLEVYGERELVAIMGDFGDSFCNVIACFYRNGNNAKWCLVQLLRGGVSYPSVLKWWWPYCFWQPFPQSTRCGFEARLRLYSMCTHTFFYNFFFFSFPYFFFAVLLLHILCYLITLGCILFKYELLFCYFGGPYFDNRNLVILGMRMMQDTA